MTTTLTQDAKTEIRAVVDGMAAGVRAKDAARVLAAFAPEAVSFSLAPPLVEPQSREGLEAWFATWRGPIGYEQRNLEITAAERLAFGHGFVRIHGTKTDGETPSVWTRQTLCLERIGGAWKIVHEHLSVPFYMDGSLRAAVDLEP